MPEHAPLSSVSDIKTLRTLRSTCIIEAFNLHAAVHYQHTDCKHCTLHRRIFRLQYIKGKGKGKGRTLVIAPLCRHGPPQGAQVHGAHQAASHIPALYLPSRSRYSFTDHERMEG